MSTVGPSDPIQFGIETMPGTSPSSSADGSGSPPDPELIQRTKNEIRGLIQEISQLSQSDLPPDQFYEGFLGRVVQALASHGGAFWSVGDGGHLKLEYQINMPVAELVDNPEPRKRHTLLLRNVLASGLPTLVPPNSGSSDAAEAGNPTEFLLVLATVGVEQETRGIIEIFQRPNGGPTTQRGYLRFLVQMSDLVGDYLKSRRLRHLGNRQTLWENLEQFLESIHQRLEVRETAYTLVNESRRLIGCDRVSLTVRRGGHQSVTAVSALDSLDRRADQVKRLGTLASAVAKTRRPLWYEGGVSELPPQIDEPLQAYVDQSHATMVAVVPLVRRSDEDASDSAESGADGEVVGTLIVEQLEDSQFHQGFRERVETVARHGGTALVNALDHESLFLMPVWRALGRARVVVEARNLPKAFAAAFAIVAMLLILTLVVVDFDLPADGRLQPAVRREVFADIDGVVIEVAARHEQVVGDGEVLARLTNRGLKVKIANVRGRQRATRERIRSVKRSQFNGQLRLEDRERLDGELLELEQAELSLEREFALLRQKQEQLKIRSPMHGQVVTWNVQNLLEGRPVRIGQALMTVVDQRGDWELELYMPEKRMGHLLEASKESVEGLPVTFVLASHPERKFSGSVTEVGQIAEVRGPEGNTVRLRVKLDKTELPELRSGTTVTAKVQCGKRAIGFVIFRELTETVRKKMLLWF